MPIESIIKKIERLLTYAKWYGRGIFPHKTFTSFYKTHSKPLSCFVMSCATTTRYIYQTIPLLITNLLISNSNSNFLCGGRFDFYDNNTIWLQSWNCFLGYQNDREKLNLWYLTLFFFFFSGSGHIMFVPDAYQHLKRSIFHYTYQFWIITSNRFKSVCLIFLHTFLYSIKFKTWYNDTHAGMF